MLDHPKDWLNDEEKGKVVVYVVLGRIASGQQFTVANNVRKERSDVELVLRLPPVMTVLMDMTFLVYGGF